MRNSITFNPQEVMRMKHKCGNCKHWKPVEYGYGEIGTCREIETELDIEIDAGWNGGIVKYIETGKDFGCVLFEKKQLNHRR